MTLTEPEIWHLRGLSWNGWMGMPAIKLAREAIGLSLALEEAHARLHGNGVQPSGFYLRRGNPQRRSSQRS
jgi:phage portal protein BeeE